MTTIDKLPKEIIELIASYLSSFGIDNLCVNKYLKYVLLPIFNEKSKEELKKTIYVRPWYPLDIKLKIMDNELKKYKNYEIVPVHFKGKKIGYVTFMIPVPWAGYWNSSYKIPFGLSGDEVIKCLKNIGFEKEIYNEYGDEYVGWTNLKFVNTRRTLEDHYTLEMAIDEIINCYRMVMDDMGLVY